MNKLLVSFLGLLLITTKTIAQTKPSSADSIQEVVIFGQKKLPLTTLHNAAKQIPYNYISSDVALEVSLDLSVFKPEALPYDYTLKTNLLWYNTTGKPLFYEAYVYADDSLRRIRNNADKINMNDYLYNYNDYPYGDFGQILKKTYQRKSSKDVDFAQLPDWIDRTDGKTYSHILLKYKQEPVTRPDGHDKDTANIGSQDLLIGIFGDFLVDKQTGAFRQIRYIYYPDQPGLYDQYLKMITDNSPEGDQNIEKVLTSNRIHILYWQVKFGLSKVYNKWFPMSYDLKNNFIFNPDIEGTNKERTVRFHYETKSILKNLPKNVTKVKFPEVMFKHTEQH
jgi:hypothetical protein